MRFLFRWWWTFCFTAIQSFAANFFPATVPDLISDINTANTNGEDDVIDLGGNTFTLTAADNGDNGLPVIAQDSGSYLLIQNGTIERDLASPNFRFFEVPSFARLRLSDLTLRNGRVSGTSMSPKFGGAILVDANGLLQTIDRCTFDNNIANGGGAIYNALYMNSVIANSTFSNNQATPFSFSDGGAFYITDSDGMIFRQNTFSGNSATGSAGALWSKFGAVFISNSTFTLNSAVNSGGALFLGDGTSLFLDSTIVADNTSTTFGPDIFDSGAGTSITEFNNLIGDNSNSGFTAGLSNGNGSYVGTGVAPIDPLLSPLANFGGPTETHALSPNSLAVDTGSNPDSLVYDQRQFGYLRSFGPSDIGAFELTCSSDIDIDGICDDVDNCIDDSNPDQVDADADGIGDECDDCPDDPLNDADGDDICGELDNCPFKANPDQTDTDDDDMGNACDTCPADDMPDDADSDGICDAADRCPGSDDAIDTDGDGIPNSCDNCSLVANNNQQDTDHDGVGNSCDTCTDLDGDGVGDAGFTNTACGVSNGPDNCPFKANPGNPQLDTDSDGMGDACDICPAGANNVDTDSDGIPNACDFCPTDDTNACIEIFDDTDGDGVPDPWDNCRDDDNADQADFDGDGIGDACDDCTDIDGDGVGDPAFDNSQCDTADVEDNCVFNSNESQEDADDDGMGDDCDVCPSGDNNEDADGDGIADACDFCPDDDTNACLEVLNDTDGDGIPDLWDNCPDDENADQRDFDGNGLGDECDDKVVLMPPPPPVPPAAPWPAAGVPGVGSGGPAPLVDTGVIHEAAKEPELASAELAPEPSVKVVVVEPKKNRTEDQGDYAFDTYEQELSGGCSLVNSPGQASNNLWLIMTAILGLWVRRRKSA